MSGWGIIWPDSTVCLSVCLPVYPLICLSFGVCFGRLKQPSVCGLFFVPAGEFLIGRDYRSSVSGKRGNVERCNDSVRGRNPEGGHGMEGWLVVLVVVGRVCVCVCV